MLVRREAIEQVASGRASSCMARSRLGIRMKPQAAGLLLPRGDSPARQAGFQQAESPGTVEFWRSMEVFYLNTMRETSRWLQYGYPRPRAVSDASGGMAHERTSLEG